MHTPDPHRPQTQPAADRRPGRPQAQPAAIRRPGRPQAQPAAPHRSSSARPAAGRAGPRPADRARRRSAPDLRLGAPALWLGLALIGLSGCSMAYDFDQLEDLPCGCLEGYSCLPSTGRCVKDGSVGRDQPCDKPTSKLCTGELVCRQRGEAGFFCRKPCTPIVYNTAAAGEFEADQCGEGMLCWAGPETGGFCAPGDCVTSDDCGVQNQACAQLNRTGRCVHTCIPPSEGKRVCIDPQTLCHPTASTQGTQATFSCLASGEAHLAQACGPKAPCVQAHDGKRVLCLPKSGSDDTTCQVACRSNTDCPTTHPKCEARYGTLGGCSE